MIKVGVGHENAESQSICMGWKKYRLISGISHLVWKRETILHRVW
jgi:hypothetical protein